VTLRKEGVKFYPGDMIHINVAEDRSTKSGQNNEEKNLKFISYNKMQCNRYDFWMGQFSPPPARGVVYVTIVGVYKAILHVKHVSFRTFKKKI
jgi:hypothetical protein